jgi:hypothetical protein
LPDDLGAPVLADLGHRVEDEAAYGRAVGDRKAIQLGKDAHPVLLRRRRQSRNGDVLEEGSDDPMRTHIVARRWRHREQRSRHDDARPEQILRKLGR